MAKTTTLKTKQYSFKYQDTKKKDHLFHWFIMFIFQLSTIRRSQNLNCLYSIFIISVDKTQITCNFIEICFNRKNEIYTYNLHTLKAGRLKYMFISQKHIGWTLIFYVIFQAL